MIIFANFWFFLIVFMVLIPTIHAFVIITVKCQSYPGAKRAREKIVKYQTLYVTFVVYRVKKYTSLL